MRPSKLAGIAVAITALCVQAQPSDFSSLVPQLVPSVVHVDVGASVRDAASAKQTDRVLGSGVIIGEDGHILTVAYLFQSGGPIAVRLHDGRQLAARLVGRDRRSEVALLKVDASGLPAAKIGDPYKLRLAERVYAMGRAPSASAPVVTDGIIAAMQAHVSDPASFLQITTPLFPGMAGGPLYNQAGEVVGINSMIHSRSTGTPLGYAIPIELAMRIAAELRARGRVQRGTLGLVIQEMTPELANIWGLAAPTGALVNSVQPNMPAARAGIEPTDLILRVAGQEVRKSTDLPAIVARLKPGEVVRVEILRARGMKREEVSVEVAELAE